MNHWLKVGILNSGKEKEMRKFKQGTGVPVSITVTLERGTTTIIIRQVPAQACDIGRSI
ncbi:MAG: hypothetical protein JXA44_13135 [Methanospirillaceae archaeon]|nr:hypothetical protein [Methanospirillaceae archaeon]